MKNNVAKRVLALLLTLAMLLPYMGELMPVMQVNAATTTYGEANVYDIYDLTGSKTNTINGTDATWDGQIHANVSAEHKENIVFKTKLTMGAQEIRLSLNALDGASIYDPSGYSVWINHNGGAPYIAIKRNMQDLVVGSPASVAGTWELEIGIVDILTDGVRTGKHLYVKKDGVIVCEADDTNGYLTGDTLGTKIIDFHYGAAIQMDTTYETTYGEAKVYDIYDLTGSRENTIKGTDESWDGQIRADVSAEHKENFAFKTKLTMSTQNVRLSLTAKDGDDIFDPPGYAVYLYGADNKVEVRRNNTALKDATVESLAGTYTFEVGIVDILFGGKRVGKHLYVKINDVVVCEYDDVDGYFTGDALGTKIIDFHYGAAIQMDTAYEGGYGTANVYDIWYLTDSTAMSVDAWASTKIGSVAEAHKEQAAIKMSMNITDARHRYRFSVGAEEGVDCTDPHGYGLEIAVQFDDSNYVKFTRGGGSQIAIFDDVSGVIGEHDLEFGYRNILLNGNVIGKQVYLSVDGEVLYTYEDLSGYLTGEALGTMVALHHIDDAAVQLNSTYGVITNGTANVYDIYDLTGSETNTLKGTDETWDGQIHANVSAEHKENIAFKTKLTMGAQEIRLSLNALDGASITDPSGYAVYINHNNGAPYIAIRRNNSDLVVGSVASVAGTWVLEIGIVDVLSDGNRIGKHLYVKKDGEIVCEVDDMNGYLTGDTLGTKIVDFHYGAAIQMDTTYKSGYGEANVYDIYDLTGSETNTVMGTNNGGWEGQKIADVSAEHKENIVFKTKLTMNVDYVRLSLNALENANKVDPTGYAVYIDHNGGAPYIAIKRNQQDLVVGSVASVQGTHELEIGIVDILTGGTRTGKHLYVKMDGVTVCEVDDTDGYLTGDALGTMIADFHVGADVQMDSTYTSSYGEPNVYDIYDLTGSATNTIKGTDESWDGQIRADVSAEHKENFAFKTKLTMGTQNVRLSLTAKDGDSHYDPVGYAVYLYGADNVVEIRRNNSGLKSASVASLAGTYTFEVGIVDILFNGSRVGKHIYVKMGDEIVCEVDDTNGYLTGDALGTKIIDFHYGAAIQMDTTYETSYGTVNVYDIYDLTGSKANTYNGSEGGNWSGNEVGTVADANKENIALKTKVMLDSTTLRDGQTDLVRLSLGATAVGLDCVGYTMRIYTDGSGNWYYGIHKGSSSVATSTVMTASDIFSTYELEFGYRDIIFKDNVIGKQIYLKKNGVEIVSYDDMSSYLTGSSLGTMVLAWGYCNSIPMESTYEASYGEANVYDIYDLTGSKTNTIKGTDETWDGQIHANVSAEHKENFAFKTKLTMGTQNVRLSLTAKDGDDIFDPPGYAVYLYGADNKVEIRRNNAALKDATVESLAGTYTFEVGVVDILLNGNRIGKHLYVKINDVIVCEVDDTNGYLTGDALGTKIIDFHYGAAIQMDSTLSFFVHSYNLTLGGSTVMNLRLDPAEINDSAATVTVSVGGTTKTYALKELPIDADGLHRVSVPLAAPQMKDEVILTVTRSDGETMTKSFTIAGYASYIYNGNYSAAQKAAVEAMLHYGAAAQTYFKYNVDNLANEGYTDSVNNTISNAYATEMTGAVSGVTIYGSSLVLGKNITLRHYLNITGDVSDYSFIFNGVEVTPQSTSVDGANYFVQLDGILPNALDGVYVLRVSKGSEAMEYKYCPMSYVERMHGKEQLADLMQELYDYHVAVKALAAANVTDSATVLDLYQITGETSVTIPVGEVLPLGLLVGAEDSFVKKELTSNVAIRFKYTGGEGMRFQLGASLQEISYTSGALFVSVPDNNSFGIYKLDQSGWMKDSSDNDLFSWQSCLGRDQTSYIELGCVKRYTNGVYTHDRYYVRAAASLAELELMAQNGTYSVYYDTTMKDNNGYSVIIRSRMNGGGDLLETTWSDEEIAAYEAKLSTDAQSMTSGNYDALENMYPEAATNNTNTAASLAAAKNPDTTTSTGGDELILWAESGTAKIVQDDDGKAATLANTKNALSIQMAKNEDEGAQLMLFGKRNVSYEVFVTDLVSGSNQISAENIRLYQLKYLTVDDKSSGGYDTPSAYAGEKLPDAMLPFAKAVEYGENTILAGNNQAIYVDVSTKSTDAAGTYTGTIVVKTASHVYTLPISVVVQNVVMPENSQLGTYAPYLGRDGFTSGELDGSDEMASLYVQTLQDFNMSSIIPESDDVLNIEKFLVNVRRNYDNLTNYMLPVDFSDSYYTVGGNKTAVYCNYALMKEYVVALAKMSIADGKNYLDKAFFYPSDHADESKTEAEFNIAKATYAAFCQMLDDADAELTDAYSGTSMYTSDIASSVKNLRFLLTVPGDDASGKALNIGTLLTEFLTAADRKNVVLCTSNEVLVREEYGDDVATAMNGAYADELWTYLSLKPYYPYSNYAFDTPVVSLRILGWTCYQESVSTLMTWKSVDYLYGPDGLSLDRWTTSSAGTSMVTPGDGNIFYPGAKYGIDGPCPSLRAIAWRDGVDDYNLMKAVVDNGGSAANLNTLYGLITYTFSDSIKASSETGSWLGSLISKNVNATVPIDDDAKFAIVRNALLQMAASATSEHAAIISNAQSAVNAVVAATGTTNALENAGSESTATISGNVYTDGYYQLADFESYAETVQNKFSGNAQLSLIGSAQNGSYSLKVAVQPGQKGETVWIPTTSKYFSATTDFSGATQITFKVYNAQASDSTVRFYLNTYDRSGDVYNAGTYYKGDSDIWHDDHPDNTSYRFTLTPGWNTITINGAFPSYVGAFVIAFDSGAGYDTQQVFYLDDVRVYMSKVG